ncbi:DNA repair protein RecO [Bacillus solimangrovi]|uniref:DNA repair protein RecO n=1 Tax=Bacillus solimangrovi TaxID=1305675 RepID=A0A1E5LI06_9BACI|nr:DNA repair protein RecO [Bacillus solimangrovi]OEH93707.1 DNA repair protein RecO [Bacillus solimangrovi]
MYSKTEGIVIRTNDYGETNKVVTLYTRDLGKIAVMARGAKKPKSRLTSVTQLFTYGSYLVQKGNGMGAMQQGEIIQSFRSIREDIFKTAYAAYIAELTDKLTEEKRSNPFIFELLNQTLMYMHEGVDIDILLNIYQIKMLDVAGIPPHVDSCVNCGHTEGTFAFSVREGGFLCHRCFSIDPYRMAVSAATLKLIRIFYTFDIARLGDVSVQQKTKNELKELINAYYDAHSGIYLKSRRFLEQLTHFPNES